jgi:1-acyl-sn-glycerol-3-phosphate acyltransferase
MVVEGVGDWARYVIKIAGGTVEVVGQELIPTDTAVVFVGNHQGNMDIPLLLGFIDKPKAFISKIEILKVPILSGWMKLMQCTFMDRKDMRQSVRAMHEAVETVKKGYSLVIFPEGTRNKGGPVGEFKAGSFKLALKSGVPIVPLTIDGSWRLLEEKGRLQDAKIKLTIHPAIPTANLTREESAALPEKVRAIIMSALPAPASVN